MAVWRCSSMTILGAECCLCFVARPYSTFHLGFVQNERSFGVLVYACRLRDGCKALLQDDAVKTNPDAAFMLSLCSGISGFLPGAVKRCLFLGVVALGSVSVLLLCALAIFSLGSVCTKDGFQIQLQVYAHGLSPPSNCSTSTCFA